MPIMRRRPQARGAPPLCTGRIIAIASQIGNGLTLRPAISSIATCRSVRIRPPVARLPVPGATCTLPPDIGNFPIMIDLPNEAGPAAEFLVRHLYRQIDVEPDSCYHAIAETADSEDDKWFWNDDNAKVLEFMSRPELWRRYPTESSEILRFVGSMCRGPFIFRRMSAPRLRAIASTGPKLRYRHSLMRISFDQRDGSVVAGIRFHDERDGENLSLCGNYVEFTYRGCRFKIPVPANGGASHAEQRGQTLRLRFSCKLHFTAFWQRRQLGDVIYTCTFDSRSMLFEVEAALDLNPAITVSDVVLTIGHGGLEYCLFSRVVDCFKQWAGPALCGREALDQIVQQSGRRLLCDPAGAHFRGIRWPSIRCRTARAARGRSRRRSETQGRLDRVIARYRFAGAHRGGRLVASEIKMITAGGLYDQVGDYAALLREAAAPAMRRSACDFSISYDYGATINALAKCFALSGAASAPTDLSCKTKRDCAGCSISHWDSMSGFTSTNMDLDPTRSSRESSPLPRWERRRCIGRPAAPGTGASSNCSSMCCSNSKCGSRAAGAPRLRGF